MAQAVAARAEVYRWTDAEGVVHFSNHDPRPAQKSGIGDSDIVQRLTQADDRRFDRTIADAATYYSLPSALVKAVVAVESGFNPTALSRAGARGLMQLMPATARAVYVADAFDPVQNIYGGTRYLRVLANRFAGDLRLTLAGYNAGPDAVDSAKGVPNFAETQRYVRRVLALYHHYVQVDLAGR